MKSMRFRAALAGVALALTCLVSHAASPLLGFDDARHLLNRSGFSASRFDIETYARLTREQAVERLLAETRREAATAPPAFTREPFYSFRRLRGLTPEERQAWQRQRRDEAVALRAWWLGEMRVTASPLTERMTLFWHNHFVSSEQKVRSPQLMYRQNALLRRHALGSFAELTHEIARDPAMVIYLDSASNRKGQPNENFAREVMELFTLGEGRYTEQDIKEAARAFTGWGIDPERGEFLFREAAHDDGSKTVLGRSGNLKGADVLNILLAHPATAEHVVQKLWREFVSPAPDAAEVKRIARVFRDNRYDIKAALRAMLTSDAFFAKENRGTLVKSPVELVVGSLRQFRVTAGDMLPFAVTTAQLGQNLFAPPNVKGWPGGVAWINSTTLLRRKQFLEQLFRSEEARPMQVAMANERVAADPMRERVARAMAEIRLDPQLALAEYGAGDVQTLQRVVLPAAPEKALAPGAQGIEALKLLTQDAVYQLK